MAEQWKDIPGYDGDYEVSDQGRVRSHKGVDSRIMKLGNNHAGYLQIGLFSKGVLTTYRVSRLVAEAFLGPPPSDRHEAAHEDNVKANNHVSNLSWLTHAENLANAAKTGRMARGERQHLSKLTAGQVLKIRRLYAEGNITYCELGKIFGVEAVTAGRAIRLKTWRHVA